MTDKLCHCGRPYRHAGHHWGPNHRNHNPGGKPGRPNNKSLFQMVVYEIEKCSTVLRETAAKIEQMQAAMKDAEARLPHLIALRNVYAPPAPKPEPVADKPKPIAVPKLAPKVVTVVSEIASEVDYTPIDATYNEVMAWASSQNIPIHFRSWDDLPGVNAVREDMELPTFKRSFAKTRTAA